MADEMKHDEAVIELTELLESDLEISEPEEEEILDLTEVVPEETEETPAAVDLSQLDISDAQIIQALENVIEKRFSGRLKAAFLETMEKVLTKEIAEIKENLQKDLE